MEQDTKEAILGIIAGVGFKVLTAQSLNADVVHDCPGWS